MLASLSSNTFPCVPIEFIAGPFSLSYLLICSFLLFCGLIVPTQAVVYTSNTFVGAGAALVINNGDTIGNGIIFQLNLQSMTRSSSTVPLALIFRNGFIGRALTGDGTANFNIYGSTADYDVSPNNPNAFGPLTVLISNNDITNAAITIRQEFARGSNFTIAGNRFYQSEGDNVGALAYYISIYNSFFRNATIIVSDNTLDYEAPITTAVARGFLNVAGGSVSVTTFNSSSFYFTKNILSLTTQYDDVPLVALICFGLAGTPIRAHPTVDPLTYGTLFANSSRFLCTGNIFMFTILTFLEGYATAFGFLGPISVREGSQLSIDNNEFGLLGWSSVDDPITAFYFTSNMFVMSGASIFIRRNVMQLYTDIEIHMILYQYGDVEVWGGGSSDSPLFSHFIISDNSIDIQAFGLTIGSTMLTIRHSEWNLNGYSVSGRFTLYSKATFSVNKNDLIGLDYGFFRATGVKLGLKNGAAFLLDSNTMNMSQSTQTAMIADGNFVEISAQLAATFSISNNSQCQELVSDYQPYVLHVNTEAKRIFLTFGGMFLIENNTITSQNHYNDYILIGFGRNFIYVTGFYTGLIFDENGDFYTVYVYSTFSVSGNTVHTSSPVTSSTIAAFGHVQVWASEVILGQNSTLKVNNNIIVGGQPDSSVGIHVISLISLTDAAQIQINDNSVQLSSSTVFAAVRISGNAGLGIICSSGGVIAIQRNNIALFGVPTSRLIANAEYISAVVISCNILLGNWNGTYELSDNTVLVVGYTFNTMPIFGVSVVTTGSVQIANISQLYLRNNKVTFDRNQPLGRTLFANTIYGGFVEVTANSLIMFQGNNLSVRADRYLTSRTIDTAAGVAITAPYIKMDYLSHLWIYSTSVRAGNATRCGIVGVQMSKYLVIASNPPITLSIFRDGTLSGVGPTAFDFTVSRSSTLRVRDVTILGDGATSFANVAVSPTATGAKFWNFSCLIDANSIYSLSDISMSVVEGSNVTAVSIVAAIIRVSSTSSVQFSNHAVNVATIYKTLEEAYPLIASTSVPNGLACSSTGVVISSAFIEVTSNSAFAASRISIDDSTNTTFPGALLCKRRFTAVVTLRPFGISSATSLNGAGYIKVSRGSYLTIASISLNSKKVIVDSSRNGLVGQQPFHLSPLRYRNNIALISIDLEGRFFSEGQSLASEELRVKNIDYASSTNYGKVATIGNNSMLAIDNTSALKIGIDSVMAVVFGKTSSERKADVVVESAVGSAPNRGLLLDRIAGVTIAAQNISMNIGSPTSALSPTSRPSPLTIAGVSGTIVNALHTFENVNISNNGAAAAALPKYFSEVVGVEIYCETLHIKSLSMSPVTQETLTSTVAAVLIANNSLYMAEGGDTAVTAITSFGKSLVIPPYATFATNSVGLVSQQGIIEGVRVTVNNLSQIVDPLQQAMSPGGSNDNYYNSTAGPLVLRIANNSISIDEFIPAAYKSNSTIAATAVVPSIGSAISVSFANPTWLAPSDVATLFQSTQNRITKAVVAITDNNLTSTSSPSCSSALSMFEPSNNTTTGGLQNLRTRNGIRVDFKGTQSVVNGAGTGFSVAVNNNTIDLLSATEAFAGNVAETFASQCPYVDFTLPSVFYPPNVSSYAMISPSHPPLWALGQVPMPAAEGLGVMISAYPATSDPLGVSMVPFSGDFISVKRNRIRSIGLSGGRGGVRIELVQPFVQTSTPTITQTFTSQPFSVTDVADNLITVTNTRHGPSMSSNDRRLGPTGISVTTVTRCVLITNNFVNVSRLRSSPPISGTAIAYGALLDSEGTSRALSTTRGLGISISFTDGWVSLPFGSSLNLTVINNNIMASTSYTSGSLERSWKAQSLLSLNRMNSFATTTSGPRVSILSNSFSWRSMYSNYDKAGSFVPLPPTSTESDYYIRWEVGWPQEAEAASTLAAINKKDIVASNPQGMIGSLAQILSALSEGYGDDIRSSDNTSIARMGGILAGGYVMTTARNAFGGPAEVSDSDSQQVRKVAWPSTLTRGSAANTAGGGLVFSNAFTLPSPGDGSLEVSCNFIGSEIKVKSDWSISVSDANDVSPIPFYSNELCSLPSSLTMITSCKSGTLSPSISTVGSATLALNRTATLALPTTTTAPTLPCDPSLVDRYVLPMLALWLGDLEFTDTEIVEGVREGGSTTMMATTSADYLAKNARSLWEFAGAVGTPLEESFQGYLPFKRPLPGLTLAKVTRTNVVPSDPNDFKNERNGFGGGNANTLFPSLRASGYFDVALSQESISYLMSSTSTSGATKNNLSLSFSFSATPDYSINIGESLTMYTSRSSLLTLLWSTLVDIDGLRMIVNGTAFSPYVSGGGGNATEAESARARVRAEYSLLERAVFGTSCQELYQSSVADLVVGSMKVTLGSTKPFPSGVSTGSSAVSGTTSVVGIISSSFLAAADLQSLAAMALHSCTDSEMKATFGTFRALSPFAIWDSYFGVIVGNLAAVGAVLIIQLFALCVLRLAKKVTDISELMALVRFPGYTLNIMFALLSGTLYASARLVSSSDPKIEELIVGSVVLALLGVGFPIFLALFAHKKIARAYQTYSLLEWASENSVATWKLWFMAEGVVYSPDTRAAYQSYISSYKRQEPFWPTYATWAPTILLIGGFAWPSSVVGCVSIFATTSILFLLLAIFVIIMRPFRSILLNMFEFIAKMVNFVVLACLAIAVYDGNTAGQAATASIIFGLFQVILTLLRLAYSVALIYLDRRMLADEVGLTIIWSHVTDSQTAKRKLFGITDDAQELLNLGVVATFRTVEEGEEDESEMKSFARIRMASESQLIQQVNDAQKPLMVATAPTYPKLLPPSPSPPTPKGAKAASALEDLELNLLEEADVGPSVARMAPPTAGMGKTSPKDTKDKTSSVVPKPSDTSKTEKPDEDLIIDEGPPNPPANPKTIAVVNGIKRRKSTKFPRPIPVGDVEEL